MVLASALLPPSSFLSVIAPYSCHLPNVGNTGPGLPSQLVLPEVPHISSYPALHL
jgi:hypothetical protein